MSKLEAKQFDTPDEVRPFTGHGHVDLARIGTLGIGRRSGYRCLAGPWSDGVRGQAVGHQREVASSAVLELVAASDPGMMTRRKRIRKPDWSDTDGLKTR